MGWDVVNFINVVLESYTILAALNITIINLIPKNENPRSVKHFILISLCKTTYKIMTKILV